jgi:hypothetical protein
VKAELQNPLGEAFVEEGEIPAGQRAVEIIHGPVKGLKIHRSYWVKVSIYEKEEHTTPVDILTQNIKSYVDTTGEEILIKTGLEQVKEKDILK